MIVTDRSFTGVRGMRFRFMRDNMPERLKELTDSGKLDEYLDEVQKEYGARLGQLFPSTMEACGATQELLARDPEKHLLACRQAERMAYEIADEEIVRAL